MRKIHTIAIVAWCFLFPACRNERPGITGALPEDRYPHLFPDYTQITLPPNIAPLHFEISEEGDNFAVSLYGKEGDTIHLRSSGPKVSIPPKKWKQLLEKNRGDTLYMDIGVRKDGRWRLYRPVANRIAAENIDPWLYYRDIVPTNSLWNKMAMHQRDLESFREYELFNNYRIERNCMNCHTFNRNNPEELLFHVRGKHGGTVLYRGGELRKIDFPVPEVISAGAYCNWHPSGRLIAFAVNRIRQNYYLSGYGDKMKEVFDLESDIVLYDTADNTVFTFPSIASPGARENLPCWSADGKYLYFVSAQPYEARLPNEKNLYSLMRAAYDAENRRMGEPELLISSDEIHGSISFPTVSPDGKYMFFCVAGFGYFPVNNKSADLYLMDLQTNGYRRPDILRSDESESYISWSSNSRWVVFSSRRLDGMTSKPYICHIDGEGNISKPFAVPQRDPAFYRIDHRNFSRPELLKGKVRLRFNDFGNVIFKEATPARYTGDTPPSP
jgi:hypothetical protein